MRHLACIGLVLVVPLVGSALADPRKSANDRVINLIDQLTEVVDEDFGISGRLTGTRFLPLNGASQAGILILNEARAKPSPVLRELVALGVDALPKLIAHLDDNRPSKLIFDQKGTVIYHSDEYPARYFDSKREPTSVNLVNSRRAKEKYITSYNVRVGDLCYVAVGQIVNRNFAAVRYQPSAHIVINSPVTTPTLAKAVKQDWSGLTKEEHRRSLIADAEWFNDPWLPPDALQRLCFYYPREGELEVCKLLARPLVNCAPAYPLVRKGLFVPGDVEQRKFLLAKFRREYGPKGENAVLLTLLWHYSRLPDDDERRANRLKAEQVLKQLFPGISPNAPGFVNAAEAREQTAVIEALESIPSREIDDAVRKVFRSLRLQEYEGYDRIMIDDLALACMQRLKDPDMNQEFEGYCIQRINELKNQQREIAENQRLDSLKEMRSELSRRR